jgi:hypothetical protein
VISFALNNIEYFRLGNLNGWWGLGRVRRISEIVVCLVTEAVVDGKEDLRGKEYRNRTVIKLLIGIILEQINEMGVDQIAHIHAIASDWVNPVLKHWYNFVIESLSEVLHGLLNLPSLHKFQSPRPWLTRHIALPQRKLKKSLDPNGKTRCI